MEGEPATAATPAEEEYLQILFWLQEAGLPMTGANVARAMQLSAPTVHEMLARLERDGYVTRGSDRAIAFTDSGAEHAAGIVRRHRLIERFLTDVLGVPWDEVHEEAERLEHAMSPVLEERMLENLLRDEASMSTVKERFAAFHGYLRQAREILMAGRRPRGAARRRASAALGHALAFSTWQSLAREQGLDDAEAAALMSRLVEDAHRAQTPPRGAAAV